MLGKKENALRDEKVDQRGQWHSQDHFYCYVTIFLFGAFFSLPNSSKTDHFFVAKVLCLLLNLSLLFFRLFCYLCGFHCIVNEFHLSEIVRFVRVLSSFRLVLFAFTLL